MATSNCEIYAAKKRPLDAFIQYFLDVKPYHTKLLEVLEIYNFYDTINVSIAEQEAFNITFANQPLCNPTGWGVDWDDSCGFDAINCCDLFDCIGGYGLIYNNSDLLVTAPVNSTTQNGTITLTGNYTYDLKLPVKAILNQNQFSVSGNKTTLFNTFNIFLIIPKHIYTISAVTSNGFTVAGNISAELVTRKTFNVYGSSGNDATYDLVTANYDASTNLTNIIVLQNINHVIGTGFIEVASSNKNNGVYQGLNSTFNGVDTIITINGDAKHFNILTDSTNGSVQFRSGLIAPRHITLSGSSANNDGDYKIIATTYDYTVNATTLTLSGLIPDISTTGTVNLYGYEFQPGYEGDNECSIPKPSDIHMEFSERLVININPPPTPTPTPTISVTPSITASHTPTPTITPTITSTVTPSPTSSGLTPTPTPTSSPAFGVSGFDPANKSANALLTNSNHKLDAAVTGTYQNYVVSRSVTAPSSGKRWVEFFISGGADSNAYAVPGFATAAFPITIESQNNPFSSPPNTDWLEVNSNFNPSNLFFSGIFTNNVSNNTSYPSNAAGTYVMFAIDFDNGKIFTQQSNTGWISGDPVAGTLPSVIFPAHTQLYYVGTVSNYYSNHEGDIIVNDGNATPFNTPPAGYTPWIGGSSPAPSPSPTTTTTTTPTQTSSITPSNTPTQTPTPTQINSHTPTPTVTVTPSPSPVTASDPYFSNVISLLHFEGANGSNTFTDVKGNTWTVTGGTPIISTANPYAGSASGYFNGTGGISSTLANTLVGDFCVECQYYALSGNSGYNTIFADSSSFGVFEITGTIVLYIGGSLISYTIPAYNQWYHLALERVSGVITLYINGISQGSYSTTTPFGPAYIGTDNASEKLLGYIDEFRATSRYRYNGNFNPPTGSFPDS